MKIASVFTLGALAITFLTACSTQPRAQHFDEAAAEERGQAGQVVAAPELERVDAVADLGAGGGYFSSLFARQVGAERGYLHRTGRPLPYSEFT